MKRALLILLFLISIARGQGHRFDELQLADGTMLEDVGITIRQPDGVIAVHSKGINKIPYELLSIRFMQQLGNFDWRQASDFRASQEKTMFTYIISGDHGMAMSAISDLNYVDFYDQMKKQFKLIHPKGRDTIWKWGVLEFINPRVWMPSDFAKHMPAILP